MPDAIGYRAKGFEDGTVLVECKRSRADFLADAKKPHRQHGVGLGRWRYYLCPEGLIHPDEVPNGWGLIYVQNGERLKVMKGRAFDKNPRLSRDEDWIHEVDHESERYLIAKVMSRVSDPDKVKAQINMAYRQRADVMRSLERSRLEAKTARADYRELRAALSRAGIDHRDILDRKASG